LYRPEVASYHFFGCLGVKGQTALNEQIRFEARSICAASDLDKLLKPIEQLLMSRVAASLLASASLVALQRFIHSRRIFVAET
jgi:hypothetical protein